MQHQFNAKENDFAHWKQLVTGRTEVKHDSRYHRRSRSLFLARKKSSSMEIDTSILSLFQDVAQKDSNRNLSPVPCIATHMAEHMTSQKAHKFNLFKRPKLPFNQYEGTNVCCESLMIIDKTFP